MIWLSIVIASALVLLTAWFAVNLVSARLQATPSLATFDIEEATVYIADHLPDRVAGRISHDEVRLLLRWHMTYLRERGVASFGGVDHAAERAARRNQIVVADEDAVVDELLRRAGEEELDLDEVDIVCVTDLTSDYLVAIGAVGAPVDVSGAQLSAPASRALAEGSDALDAPVLGGPDGPPEKIA